MKTIGQLLVLSALILSTLACGVELEPENPTAPAATLAVTLPAATARPPQNPVPLPPKTTATHAPVAMGVQVYFSSPAGESGEDGAVENAVVADLDAARESIDIAMYNLSLQRVESALIHAFQRGVLVRYVTDSDDLDDAPLQRLKKAGIKIVADRRQSIMHNKFLVIDGLAVWTGSLNLTGSGAYQDNNNFVRFVSPEMAKNYTVEFEEMFLKDGFSTDGVANTPNPKLSIGTIAVENYFSPEDKVSKHLTPLLNAAKEEIHFLAYSFTSDPLSNAIIERAKAGVTVRGVVDSEQYRSNTGGEFDRMKQAGLDVHLDGNPGLMHHKVMIIDRKTVIFGSYNFSGNADRQNDENVVVVTDANLAAQFEAEFQRVYGQAK